MDTASRHFYLVLMKYEISQRTGVSFQDFFVQVASIRWGTDFEARRPQGKEGDGKCDGYRVSNKCVFQAYGTRKMEPGPLCKKIKIDFEGALAEFGPKMAMWILVHNDTEGLPKKAHDLIFDLRALYPSITIEIMGPVHILDLADGISEEKRSLLCPNLPSDRDLRRVQFKEIDAIIAAINTTDIDPNTAPPRIPSSEKLSFNNFSPCVAEALKQGELVARTVGKYFEDTSRADLGNSVCERFKLIYQEKKKDETDPDTIYFSLAESVGGLGSGKARSSAVIGILAYLFHTCEIFEDTPKGDSE